MCEWYLSLWVDQHVDTFTFIESWMHWGITYLLIWQRQKTYQRLPGDKYGHAFEIAPSQLWHAPSQVKIAWSWCSKLISSRLAVWRATHHHTGVYRIHAWRYNTIKFVLVKPLTNKNPDLCCMDTDTSTWARKNTAQQILKCMYKIDIMAIRVSDMCVRHKTVPHFVLVLYLDL